MDNTIRPPVHVTVDVEKRRVFKGAEEIVLSPTEYRILAYLASHPGKLFTREEIASNCWGPDDLMEDFKQGVKVYTLRLRRKLGDDFGRQQYMISRRGFGVGVSSLVREGSMNLKAGNIRLSFP